MRRCLEGLTGLVSLVSLVGLMLLFAGCPADPPKGSDKTVVRVLAASSLTEAFRRIEADYEHRNPQVDLRMVFAGSQILSLQIQQGVSADVFACANEEHMQVLLTAGHVKQPRSFAQNDLVIIVPHDNPAQVESLSDLKTVSRIVLGTAYVPVGIYAQQVLDKAEAALGPGFAQAVRGQVVSRESNARLVRAKVALGEAQAALVYRSDAVSSKRVIAIDIPASQNVEARYMAAPLSLSAAPAAARDFIDYLVTPKAQSILQGQGFLRSAP